MGNIPGKTAKENHNDNLKCTNITTNSNRFYPDDKIIYAREIDAFMFCSFCIDGNFPEVLLYCKKFPVFIRKNFYTFRSPELAQFNYYGATGFTLACIAGNIKIAKWLYSKDPDIVDISDSTGCIIYDYVDYIKNK